MFIFIEQVFFSKPVRNVQTTRFTKKKNVQIGRLKTIISIYLLRLKLTTLFKIHVILRTELGDSLSRLFVQFSANQIIEIHNITCWHSRFTSKNFNKLNLEWTDYFPGSFEFVYDKNFKYNLFLEYLQLLRHSSVLTTTNEYIALLNYNQWRILRISCKSFCWNWWGFLKLINVADIKCDVDFIVEVFLF